jgi:hypothetical protein
MKIKKTGSFKKTLCHSAILLPFSTDIAISPEPLGDTPLGDSLSAPGIPPFLQQHLN